MKRKDFLLHLIKSLSRTEKRYLKINFKHANKEAIYLQLLTAIDKQEEYDEEVLKVKFKEYKFVKHFHLSKRYLYDLILQALRNYHREISQKARVNDLLKNVEILYLKGLYPLAERDCQQAGRIADTYELDTAKLDVLFWQRKLIQAQTPGDRQRIGAVVQEQHQVITDLQQLNGFWQKLLQLTPDPSNPRPSLQARILRANVDYLQLLNERRIQEAETTLTALVNDLERYPKHLKNDPSIWPSNLNNLLGLLLFEKKQAPALELIQKAKVFYASLPQLDTPTIRLILRTYNIELELYRDRKDRLAAQGAIEDIQVFLQNQKGNVPSSYLLSFWFQFANLHFWDEDYEQSLHWINRVLNGKFIGERLDLQRYIRWLNLMVHTELENYFVLRYYVGSMRRFLKKHGTIATYEQVLLRFFVQISTIGESDMKSAFAKLHSQLSEVSETLQAERVLDYINFLDWSKERSHLS
ncbi:MAG: hypothetical protein KTR30_05695 [Saprospiraceae bacterium]|nr:hypothetical protein [Saprospiraceae bacterium]